MSEAREEKIKRIMAVRDQDVVVVLEDIHDPHNAGAILRSCDAFGIHNVWFVFEKEKAYNPKRVGKVSSSSANKWLEFKIFKSTEHCMDALESEGYHSLATTIHENDAVSLFECGGLRNPHIDLKKGKIALIVGNEHRGVSQDAIRRATTRITIPMQGFVESLNVSVTAAIFLYEIIRQRQINVKAKP